MLTMSVRAKFYGKSCTPVFISKYRFAVRKITVFNWFKKTGLLGVYLSHVIFILFYCIFSFYRFSPLSYGMHGPMAADEASSMHGLQWLDSWEI